MYYLHIFLLETFHLQLHNLRATSFIPSKKFFEHLPAPTACGNSASSWLTDLDLGIATTSRDTCTGIGSSSILNR